MYAFSAISFPLVLFLLGLRLTVAVQSGHGGLKAVMLEHNLGPGVGLGHGVVSTHNIFPPGQIAQEMLLVRSVQADILHYRVIQVIDVGWLVKRNPLVHEADLERRLLLSTFNFAT